MPAITLVRTDIPMPPEHELERALNLLFDCFRGVTDTDNKRWWRFWKSATEKEQGEMFDVETVFPRYTPFHKQHMKIEQDVFNAQERFRDFEMFRNWLKIGAGFVVWVPGAKGGIVPLPKSASYAKTDEKEFREFHAKAMEFLRGEHAAPYLWKQLEKSEAHEKMETILPVHPVGRVSGLIA